MSTAQLLPLLSVYGTMILPGTTTSINVLKPSEANAIKIAVDNRSKVFLGKQKEFGEEANDNQIYSTGVICNIVQIVTFPDKSIKIIIEGDSCGKISTIKKINDYFNVEVFEILDELILDENREIAYKKLMVESIQEYCDANKNINSDDLISNMKNLTEINKIITFIAQQINLDNKKQQEIINLSSTSKRVELILKFVKDEIEISKIESKIRNIVRNQIEKRQKDIYLNEQLQAIHKELGLDKTGSEFEKIENKLSALKMPSEIRKEMEEHLNKLQMMNPISAEATVLLNYLHTVCNLPWNKNKKISINLERTEKILDDSHFGLNKIKERILEYLAVQKHTNNGSAGPIICLVGPPGVGKTSLGQSIAQSMNREFALVPLGGVSDEAEIRGHRRTYIGAMPGKIIQQLTKVKYNNPVMMLDEIDKISSDFRGDPSAALLQVLDPEQNKRFSDHYLDVEYDLSQIMFICTANTLNMSTPLLDRMEVIKLSSYTEEEKLEIAKKHLVKKNMKIHKLSNDNLSIDDEAIKDVIKYYTREAGVRNLEREIAKICRKTTKKIVDLKEKNKKSKSQITKVNSKNLEEFLGVKKFIPDKANKKSKVGLVTGLAWTEIGGTVLSIEAVSMHGDGKIILTGKLGDVMKESIQAAQAYVKSKIDQFNINKELLEKTDLHIHVPDGATPKDGPSAGIAMIICIISTLTDTPVNTNVAMTGEISLHGDILPVGGIKEKVLAAIRNDIKTIIIPEDNKKDLQEIEKDSLSKVTIHCVKTVEEVVKIALEKKTDKAKKNEKENKPKNNIITVNLDNQIGSEI